MKQLLLDLNKTDPPTLENFIPGNNTELLHALKNLIAGRQKDRFLYLWGQAGSGRSHLLQAVTDVFLQQHQQATYIDCALTDKFSFSATMACVAVDNVERLDAPGQIKLFNLYNRIYENNQGIFLASGTAPPAQLDLRPDLTTRLGWGLVYQVHELADENKIEVMKGHAKRCGFELSQEICDYLLKHAQRDLPSLIKLINALDRFSLARQRPVTLPLLRELLQSASSRAQS